MALELPGWLVVAFNFVGLPWPGIDEDELRAWARGVRSFADGVSLGTGRAGSVVAGLAAGSESSFTATLGARWEHVDRLVAGLRGPLDDFAEALDVAADAVVVQKEAVIAAAAALAAEFTATQLGAIATLGADEAAVPAEVAATRWLVKLALQELEAELAGKLVGGAVHLVSGHVGRFISGLLNSAVPVAMEAQSLKVSYEALREAAKEIRGHAAQTEDAATAAYKENASRDISDPGEGGRWPVARVVEEALLGVATDLFRSLPGAVFQVMQEIAGRVERAAQALEEEDQALAGEVPQVADPGPDGVTGPGSPAGPGTTEVPADTGAGGADAGLKAAGKDPAAGEAVEGRPAGGDPVDLATGDVILAEVDVTLPGVLPLVVERSHRSSWRAGRWFGGSWLSSFDQRLVVEDGKVAGAFADGRVLSWELAGSAGGPVLPVSGPAWPLRREAGGSFTVTDPQRGLAWRFAPRPGAGGDGGGVLPLAAVSDRAGHEVTFTYDAGGQPSGVAHSGGYHVRVMMAGGRVASLVLAGRDGAGDVPLVSYDYDGDGNLAGVVNSSGQPLRYSYDPAGRLTGWEDRNGQFYRYSYDERGRCARGEGPDGALSGTFAYEPGTTRWTDAAGAVTAWEVTPDGRVAAATDPLGSVTRWEHDGRGRVTTRVDPLGRVTRYAWDEAGNLIAVTRPDGSQSVADYDEDCQPVLVTGPDGSQWRQEHDARGNLTRLVAPGGAETTYGYDDRGHLAQVTDPGGAVTTVACDAAGLPVAVSGPDGAATRYERDQLGRITRITAPDGGVTALAWTTEGKPASRSFPDGSAESWEWDGEGNLARHVSAGGAVTSWEYGPFDKVTGMRGPDGTRTQLSWDHRLRLAEVAHAGLSWRYDYDPAGRLAAETDYNGATTTYAHDAAGQLTRRLNAAGQETRYGYDAAGNLAESTADGVVTEFGYDPAGRLIRARNADAEVTLERDAAGRVTAETCNGRTVTTRYDAAGRVTSRRTPSGAEAAWEHDQAGRPVELTASGHQLRFGYDAAGREARRELPGGLALTQEWDQRGRLTLQSLTSPGSGPGAGGPLPEGPAAGGRVLQRRSYTYDPDGLVTGIADLLAGNRAIGLDPAGRVTTVAGPGWAEYYAYDPVGNLAEASWPAPPAPAPHATGNGDGTRGRREVTGTLITRAGNIRYRHDRQGRVTQRQRMRISRKADTWHYQWDADNRLTAVTTPDGSTWHYTYDPLGRRIAKHRQAPDGTTTTRTGYTWDGPLLAEQVTTTGDARQEVTTWTYQPGTFTPLTQAGHTSLRDAPQEHIDRQFHAIITDLAGTPAELAGTDGTIAGHQASTLWGTTTWTGGASTPLRFPGQYHDPETGLHYNNQRYYDPDTAAYLTPDPLGLAPALNPHAYVPNPHTHTDPLGLKKYRNAPADHIVLGLDSPTLEEFAKSIKGRSLMNDKDWAGTVWTAGELLKLDPSYVRVSFTLDNMQGAEEGVDSAVGTSLLRSARQIGGATDKEIAMLKDLGVLKDVDFYIGGKLQPNPFR